jgi:hypothetical protein
MQRQVLPGRNAVSLGKHSITSQTTGIFRNAPVRTWNLTWYKCNRIPKVTLSVSFYWYPRGYLLKLQVNERKEVRSWPFIFVRETSSFQVENDHAMSFIISFLDISLLAVVIVKSNTITINSGNPTQLIVINSYK